MWLELPGKIRGDGFDKISLVLSGSDSRSETSRTHRFKGCPGEPKSFLQPHALGKFCLSELRFFVCLFVFVLESAVFLQLEAQG